MKSDLKFYGPADIVPSYSPLCRFDSQTFFRVRFRVKFHLT